METDSEVIINLDKCTEFTYVPVIRVSGILKGLTPVGHEDSLFIKKIINLPVRDRKLILKLIDINDESKIMIEEMVSLNDKMLKMNEELKKMIEEVILSTSVVPEVIRKLLKMNAVEVMSLKRIMEFDSREWELVKSFIQITIKEKIFVINFMNWFHKQNHFGVLSKSTMRSFDNSKQSSFIESELRTLVSRYILEQGTHIKKIATETLKQMSPKSLFNKCSIESEIPKQLVDSNSETSKKNQNFSIESQDIVPVTYVNENSDSIRGTRIQMSEIIRKDRDDMHTNQPLFTNTSSTAALPTKQNTTNLSSIDHTNTSILKTKPEIVNKLLNRNMNLGKHQLGQFEKRLASNAEKKSLENWLLKESNTLQVFVGKNLHHNITSKEIHEQNTSNNETGHSTSVCSEREVSCNKITSSQVNNSSSYIKHSKSIPTFSSEIQIKKSFIMKTRKMSECSPSKFTKTPVLQQYRNRNKQNKPVENVIPFTLGEDNLVGLQSNAETESIKCRDNLLTHKIESNHGDSGISRQNNDVATTNSNIEAEKSVHTSGSSRIQRKDMVHIIAGTEMRPTERSEPKQSGLGNITDLNNSVAQRQLAATNIASGVILALDSNAPEEETDVSNGACIKHVLKPVVNLPDTSTGLQSNARINRNMKIVPKPSISDVAVVGTLQNSDVYGTNVMSPESRSLIGSSRHVKYSSNAVELATVSALSNDLETDIPKQEKLQKSSCEENSTQLNITDVTSEESNKTLGSDLNSLLMSIKDIKEDALKQVQGNDKMIKESSDQENSESNIALYPLNISVSPLNDDCLSSGMMIDSREMVMNKNLMALTESAVIQDDNQNIDGSDDRCEISEYKNQIYQVDDTQVLINENLDSANVSGIQRADFSSSETDITKYQDGNYIDDNAVTVLNNKKENDNIDECSSVTDTFANDNCTDARLHNTSSSNSSTGRNSRIHVSEQQNRYASRSGTRRQQRNSEMQIVLQKSKSLEPAAVDVQEGTSSFKKCIVKTTDNFRKRMLCRGRSLYVVARSIKQFFTTGNKEINSHEFLNQAKEFHHGSKLLQNSLKRFLQKMDGESKIFKVLTGYRNEMLPLIRELNLHISNIKSLPKKNLTIVKDIIKLMNIIAEIIKIAPKEAENGIKFVDIEEDVVESDGNGGDDVDLEVVYMGKKIKHEETQPVHTLPSGEKEIFQLEKTQVLPLSEKQVPHVKQTEVSKEANLPDKRGTLKACCVSLNDVYHILKGRTSLKLEEFERLQANSISENNDDSEGFRGFDAVCCSRGIKRKNDIKLIFDKYKAKKLKLDVSSTDIEHGDGQLDLESRRSSSSENIQISIKLEPINMTGESCDTITSDINSEATSNVQMPCIKQEILDESYDYSMNTSQGLNYDLAIHNKDFLQQMDMTPVKKECIIEMNEFELVIFDDLNTVVYSVSTDGQTDLTNIDSEPIISLNSYDYHVNQYDQDPLQINPVEISKRDDDINDVKYSKDDPSRSQSLTGVAADIVQAMEKTLDKPPLPLEGPGKKSWCLYTSALDHNYAGKFKGQKKQFMYSLQEKSIVNIHHYDVPNVQYSLL